MKYSNNALYTFFLEDEQLLDTINNLIKSRIPSDQHSDYKDKSIDEIFDLNDLRNQLQSMTPNSTVFVRSQENISQKARRALTTDLLYKLSGYSRFKETGFRVEEISQRVYEIQGIIFRQDLNSINLPRNDLAQKQYKSYD